MVIDKGKGKPKIIMDESVYIVEWDNCTSAMSLERDIYTGRALSFSETSYADLILTHNAFNSYMVKKSSILPVGTRIKLSNKQLKEYETMTKGRLRKLERLLDEEIG
jgi:hypothetical protein